MKEFSTEIQELQKQIDQINEWRIKNESILDSMATNINLTIEAIQQLERLLSKALGK